MASLVFDSIVALPTASFPTSLNLSTSNNGVTAISFGNNVKAVLFNKENITTGSNILSLNIEGNTTTISVADSYNNKTISLLLDNGESFVYTINTATQSQTNSSFNSFNSVSTEKLRRWNLGYGGDGIGDPSNIVGNPVFYNISTDNVIYNISNLTNPNYLVVNTLVTTFSSYLDNNLLGIKNNVNLSNFASNNVELILTLGLSANKLTVPVTESATVSTNQGNLYTLFYSNTGSAILGLAKSNVILSKPESIPDFSSDFRYSIEKYVNQLNQVIDVNNAAQIFVYSNSISSFKANIESTEVTFKTENVGIYPNLAPLQKIIASYGGIDYEIFKAKKNYLTINNIEYLVVPLEYTMPSKGTYFLIFKASLVV